MYPTMGSSVGAKSRCCKPVNPLKQQGCWYVPSTCRNPLHTTQLTMIFWKNT